MPGLSDGEIFNNALVLFTPFGGAELDLSDHVTEVMLERSRDEKDVTRMGHLDKARKNGLGEWKATMTLLQDFTSSGKNIDKTIWDQLAADGVGVLKMRAFNAARSSTNPEYVGNCIVGNHRPFGGKVGDILMTSPEFKSSGTLTRVTTSS